MRHWKGCTWALCLLFLLLRPTTSHVLPESSDATPNKPVLEPIFSRDAAPAIRNPVPMEEVQVTTTTTTTKGTTTTTTTPAPVTSSTTTTKAAEVSTTKKVATTEAPKPKITTTTNRYKLYLRALGLLNSLLTTKSFPLLPVLNNNNNNFLNTSSRTSSSAKTTTPTHAFYNNPIVAVLPATIIPTQAFHASSASAASFTSAIPPRRPPLPLPMPRLYSSPSFTFSTPPPPPPFTTPSSPRFISKSTSSTSRQLTPLLPDWTHNNHRMARRASSTWLLNNNTSSSSAAVANINTNNNNGFLTQSQINNRSRYNSKRMLHSMDYATGASNSAAAGSVDSSSTKNVAIGILRALWDDYSHRNGSSPTKYVPIALTAPSGSSGMSTVKSIVIESTKNKILPYPPSNLITIHNFHPSVDELRPATSRPDPHQHMFQNSDYENWNEAGDSSNSEEIMSQLPIAIKRSPPIVTATVTVRPLKVHNKMQPLRIQVFSSHENLDIDAGQETNAIGGEEFNGDHQNTGTIHSAGSNDQEHSGQSNKPEKLVKVQKNKTRKKTIKNKLKQKKKSPVSSTTTSSTIIVAEEEYGSLAGDDDATEEEVEEPLFVDSDSDDPVDPDLETEEQDQKHHQEDGDEVESNKNTDNDNDQQQEQSSSAFVDGEEQQDSGSGHDLHHAHFSNQVLVSSVKADCPRGNKFSASRDDRCRRSNKKRPKQKFDIADWTISSMIQDESDEEDLSRHKIKVPKIKVPKIKPPKIKIPKIKPPKVKLSLKDMPTMMAMMKTFFHGVSMATMFNPMNFGLWTVVLHPVTMLLIGLGGLLMYCFPWTSVALLTSRKHSGNTIEVHRYGRRVGAPTGRVVTAYERPDSGSGWLDDQATWILGAINNYTFQMDLSYRGSRIEMKRPVMEAKNATATLPASTTPRAEPKIQMKRPVDLRPAPIGLKESLIQITDQLRQANLKAETAKMKLNKRPTPKIDEPTEEIIIYETSGHDGVAMPLTMEDIEREMAQVEFQLQESTPKEGISTWILLSGSETTPQPPSIAAKGPAYVVETEKKLESDKKIDKIMKVKDSKESPVLLPKRRPTTTAAPLVIVKAKPKPKKTTTTTTTTTTTEAPLETSSVKPKVKPESRVNTKRPRRPTTTTTTTQAPETTTEEEITEEPVEEKTQESSFLIIEPKDSEFDLPADRSPIQGKKKTPITKPLKKKKKPDVKNKKKPLEQMLEDIVSGVTEKPAKTPNKNKEKPISTQIMNYLSREVMPTVGVGIIGLVAAAGVATYFLGNTFTPLRRSDRADEIYYNNNEEYAGPDGQFEEEWFSKVMAGSPTYRNNLRQAYKPAPGAPGAPGAPNGPNGAVLAQQQNYAVHKYPQYSKYARPPPGPAPGPGYAMNPNHRNYNVRPSYGPGGPGPAQNYRINAGPMPTGANPSELVRKHSMAMPHYPHPHPHQYHAPPPPPPQQVQQQVKEQEPHNYFSEASKRHSFSSGAGDIQAEPEGEEPTAVDGPIEDSNFLKRTSQQSAGSMSPSAAALSQQFVVGSVYPEVLTAKDSSAIQPESVPEHGPRRRRGVVHHGQQSQLKKKTKAIEDNELDNENELPIEKLEQIANVKVATDHAESTEQEHVTSSTVVTTASVDDQGLDKEDEKVETSTNKVTYYHETTVTYNNTFGDFIRRMVQLKLKLGVSFLRGMADGVAKYLHQVEERLYKGRRSIE